MESVVHDPAEYIRGIQQILVSDKKRIGFLFGAGSSLAKKNSKSLTVPAIYKKNEDYKTALVSIRKELEIKFNIETLLSNLEQKESLIGEDKLNGLDRLGFKKLIKDLKEQVRIKVSVHLDNGEVV